jgi:hypothetical protein
MKNDTEYRGFHAVVSGRMADVVKAMGELSTKIEAERMRVEAEAKMAEQMKSLQLDVRRLLARVRGGKS